MPLLAILILKSAKNRKYAVGGRLGLLGSTVFPL